MRALLQRNAAREITIEWSDCTVDAEGTEIRSEGGTVLAAAVAAELWEGHTYDSWSAMLGEAHSIVVAQDEHGDWAAVDEDADVNLLTALT
jgi:hypothetical protein